MSGDQGLKKKIQKWLKDQGYPLEMRVATSFRKKGFDVIQSHFYSDPENEIYREIDIVASLPEFTGIIDISFVIECKSSKKKPWLLFTSEHVLEGWNILNSFCIHSKPCRKALIDKGIETVIRLPWMKKKDRVAYGITQAFKTGEDVTFKASTSVLKAAIARKKYLHERNLVPLVFVFPIIVLEGSAMECFIDGKGRMSIKEIQEGFYFLPLDIAGENGTCIKILTVDRLARVIGQAKNISESILALLKDDIDKKLKLI